MSELYAAYSKYLRESDARGEPISYSDFEHGWNAAIDEFVRRVHECDLYADFPAAAIDWVAKEMKGESNE